MTETTGLAEALAKAQGEFPAIERTRTVEVTTRTGGRYEFRYAPLEHVRAVIQPVLTANDLSVSQLLDELDGAPALRTVLMHKSGGQLESRFPLPVRDGMSAQEIGSAITYMRRYALVAALGLATEEDDDGGHASGSSTREVAARTAGGSTQQADDGERPAGAAPAAPADNPAAAAQAAYERASVQPDYDGTAESVTIEMGKKHNGKRLGDIWAEDPGYVHWLASKFEPRTKTQRLYKNAAMMLAGQGAEPLPAPSGADVDDSIPFGPAVW